MIFKSNLKIKTAKLVYCTRKNFADNHASNRVLVSYNFNCKLTIIASNVVNFFSTKNKRNGKQLIYYSSYVYIFIFGF